jgi:hypothetical protein
VNQQIPFGVEGNAGAAKMQGIHSCPGQFECDLIRAEGLHQCCQGEAGIEFAIVDHEQWDPPEYSIKVVRDVEEA